LTKKQVRSIFENIKYKTITFEIDQFAHGQVHVMAGRELFHPLSGRSVGLVETVEVFNYYSCTETQLLLAVRDWIHRAECHEADEHFIYKGDQVFHPHAAKVSLY